MDYKQELISTIHDLGCDLDALEAKMIELTSETQTAILIPALYEEIERPALTIIKKHLQQCQFVQTIVVCVYADTKEQYKKVVEFFKPLPQQTFILWENGKRVTDVLEGLRARDLDLMGYRGKGRAVWLGLGIC